MNISRSEETNKKTCGEKEGRKLTTIPHESRANSRLPARVGYVEGGAVCSQNRSFGYFDGTAWTPRLRSATPIMTPGSIKQ